MGWACPMVRASLWTTLPPLHERMRGPVAHVHASHHGDHDDVSPRVSSTIRTLAIPSPGVRNVMLQHCAQHHMHNLALSVALFSQQATLTAGCPLPVNPPCFQSAVQH
eukprot:362965-Chlamydomonas_euryale.AAC.12